MQHSQSNSRRHWDLRRGCPTGPQRQPWMYPPQAAGSLHSRGKRQAWVLLCDFGWNCWTPASQSQRCLVTKEQTVSATNWDRHKEASKIYRQQAYSIYPPISWKMSLLKTQRAYLVRCLGHPVRYNQSDWQQGPVQLLNTVPELGGDAGLNWEATGTGEVQRTAKPWRRQASRLSYWHSAVDTGWLSTIAPTDLTWSRTGQGLMVLN